MLKFRRHLAANPSLGLFISVVIFSPISVAAESWRYCAPVFSSLEGLSTPQELANYPDSNLYIIADEARADDQLYFLRGDVIGRQEDQELLADKVDYDATTDSATAEGNIRYQQDGKIVSGEKGDFQLGSSTGTISAARFWMLESHLRGDAQQVELLGPALTDMETVQFTTCDEGSGAWYLKASSLELNKDTGVGVARNTRLEVMNVPVFYFPYLSFPIDDRRKSGFLSPSVAVDDTSGTTLSTPYYWNIAPHRDATVAPTIITERGVMLETEFRYLNDDNAGQLDVGYLYDDKLYGADRSLVEFQHRGAPADGWWTNLEYRYGSDGAYLNDFGDGLVSTSISHLERRADLNYSNENWQGGLLLQEFQTLDQSISPTSYPYKRLPQLTLRLNDRALDNGLHYGIGGHMVRFDRDAGVIGSRVDIQPYVSWPRHGDAGFVVPTLKYQHTAYQLSRSSPAYEASPSRSLPLFSLDSGLYFERTLTGGGRASRQTLEPRLFYLYVPYRDQADLIVDQSGNPQVFDTSLSGFGFDQLFRDDRFIGVDRVGDANQISLALSTRFLDAEGRDLLNASLGRIVYFQDRKVTLPGGSVATETSSDWIAELNSQWTNTVSARANLLWDTAQNHASTASLDLRYYRDRNHALRMAYRYQRGSQSQLDLAGMWSLAAQWNLVGRWLHSVHHNVTLETLAGVEYESCCWNLRLVQRRSRVSVNDNEMSNTIWLQLELKGLTSVGKRVNDLVARDILAY